MRKSLKFAGIVAGTLVLTSLLGMSAIADSRPPDESAWRERRIVDPYDDRYEDRNGQYSHSTDRDLLSGVVERIDLRRGVAFVRAQNGRRIAVEMSRRHRIRGIDVEDLRRGDVVTFAGDWAQRSVFRAWRIEDVDGRRGRASW